MKLIINRKSLLVGVASPRFTAFFIGRSAVDGRPAVVVNSPRQTRVFRPVGGK